MLNVKSKMLTIPSNGCFDKDPDLLDGVLVSALLESTPLDLENDEAVLNSYNGKIKLNKTFQMGQKLSIVWKTFLLFLLFFAPVVAKAQLGILADKYYITGGLSVGQEARNLFPDTSAWMQIGGDTTNKGFIIPRILGGLSTVKRGVFYYSLEDSTLRHKDGTAEVKYLTDKDSNTIKTWTGGGLVDTAHLAARIDSNETAIKYLDSTAFFGKPVSVQRVMIEGQSNCDGSDVDTTSLTTAPLNRNQFELLDTFNRVYTWDYTNNEYKKLKAGVTNYGRTNASFGSELSFAARWEKNNPDGILVIDKKCLYGQDIPQFQKGGAQYTAILDGRPLADAWLAERGYRVKNTAWVFIQGESDYLSAGYEYLAALNQLVTDKFSDGLLDSTTRIVISQVSTEAPLYGEGVDSAQVAFVNAAPNRKLINNDSNTIGVGNHYDAAGYVQLGLSAYTQAFDADSLKTLDEFMHQTGVGTITGRLKLQEDENAADAASDIVGAPATLTVSGDNLNYVPLTIHSPSAATTNSSMMWFVAGSQNVGSVFAANPAYLLVRGAAGYSLAFGANNRNADMVIESATGNVGVGYGITPVSKFDVLGTIRGRDTVHGQGEVYFNGLPRGRQDSIFYKGVGGRAYIGVAPMNGTYTPVKTNVTNVSGSISYVANYTRVANVVTVFGKIDIQATAAGGTATELALTLPVASNFTLEQDLAGTAASEVGTGYSARIKADVTNDRASIVFKAQSTTVDAYSFQFSYVIK